ncbi:SpoIIE family protein phosphatase [Streptomyces sp. V4-01]|uniref:SpoIIE family protein phosphatase n=1 Tax=Actinacidiphila polyblastidii TaxID=3110430 RepID=A0ABU7PEH0_9ACTN|nr:SpoIIE family protein phosphatase [Streptomyces sp. V4-01]
MAREVFEQAPAALAGMAGPEHLIVAVNAAYRAMIGRQEMVGSTAAALYPEAVLQGIVPLFDRVYATGVAETKKAWRMQITSDAGLQEFFFDFTLQPWFEPDGAVAGVIVHLVDVSEQIVAQQAAEARAVAAEARYEQARSTLAALQEALLPATLPLLPELDLAARYVLAEADTAAGGDWYDTVVLPDGRVALVVGDVVGHGVQASAVMGQLRSVVQERLRAGCTPAQALQAADAHARHVPGAQAATCCITLADPADGHLRYASAGHPPPLLIAPDGSTGFLPATGQGPLATGAVYTDTEARLPQGGTVLLYSDGIVERPGLTPEQGRQELRRTAGAAAVDQLMPHNSPHATAERTVVQTLEVLLRDNGHSDDVTLLAAHRRPGPEALELTLPAEVDSVRAVQFELGQWLVGVGCGSDDESALQHAVVELVTNTVDHAYTGRRPSGTPREVTVRARLTADGTAHIDVTDHGRWSDTDQPDPYRGRGLSMVEMFTDTFTIDKGTESGPGSTVTITRTLHRPAALTQGTTPADPRHHTLSIDADPDTPGLVHARGTADTTTAQHLTDTLMTTSRGGTLPLTLDLAEVTHLASAAVQALHRATTVFDQHGQPLTLHAPRGSVAAAVLDLAALPYRTDPPPTADRAR